MMINWNDVIPIATLFSTIGTLVTAIVLILQVRVSINSQKDAHASFVNVKNVSQADIIMKFFDRLSDDKMLDIAGAIAGKQPILIKNGGTINEYELIKYMTIFSQINQFMTIGILDIHVAYSPFVNYAVPLSKNKEIGEYIESVRKNQNPRTWEAIFTLGKRLEDFSQLMDSIKEKNSKNK